MGGTPRAVTRSLTTFGMTSLKLRFSHFWKRDNDFNPFTLTVRSELSKDASMTGLQHVLFLPFGSGQPMYMNFAATYLMFTNTFSRRDMLEPSLITLYLMWCCLSLNFNHVQRLHINDIFLEGKKIISLEWIISFFDDLDRYPRIAVISL